MATRGLVSPILDTNQHPLQIVHGLSVKNQENFQHQHQSKLTQSHDAHHPANILALPTELLYDALDYLSTEDLVSFASCRWDMFHALIGFLERKARPSLQGIGLLVTLFEEQWPRKWLRIIVPICARSEQPILRDLETLVELFEDNHWPKEQLQEIIIISARRDQPTVHSCVELGFEELACLYLRKSPHTLFDTNNLHMTVLHFSVLNRSQNIVQEIGTLGDQFIALAQNYQTIFLIARGIDCDHAVRIPFAQFVNPCIEYGLPISSARFVEILASSGGVSSDEISLTVALVYIHWLGTSLVVRPGHDNDIEQVMRCLECAWEAQAGGDLQELNVGVILT